MKKIIASAGFTVLGAACLHATDSGLLTPQEKSKIWTIGLAVNGFYDGNYNAAPTAQGSAGIEVIPSFGLNLLLDQTSIGLNISYDLRWYEARPDHKIDQMPVVDFTFSHAFSERLKVSVADRFVYADEPDVLDTAIIANPTLRSDQSAFHNQASAALSYDFTEKIGIEVSLSNGWYDYQQEGAGSLAALMNRMDNIAGLNLRWYLQPTTTLLIGYQYEWLDYTSDDSLAVGPYVNPNIRNYNSSYIYAGVDHNFTAEFSASLRLGAQITEYNKLHDMAIYSNVDDSQVSPYVDASMNYVYNPGSFVKLGIRSTLNATDVAYVNSVFPVLNQQSTAGYMTWSHRIAPQLTSTVTGLFQASEFNGGGSPVDGETDYLGMVGVDLSYQINSFLSADIGYAFDRLSSDIPNRGYTRNRGFFGLSAKY